MAVLLLMGSYGIGQDEWACEEATRHLLDCCPELESSLRYSCAYIGDCNPTYPALGIPESQCIEGSSCEALRKAGVCDIRTWRTTVPQCP